MQAVLHPPVVADVSGLLVDDRAGDLALTAHRGACLAAISKHRIDGDDGAMDLQQGKQLRDGDDLVRRLVHLHLAETIWIVPFLSAASNERRKVFPSMAPPLAGPDAGMSPRR